MPPSDPSPRRRLLGGLTPAQFMRRHWQKSPHLIRGAIPGFDGILDVKALFALAARDDVESRLIIRGAGKRDWTLEHGPFRISDFRSLPANNWTLLVQGVDLHLDAGAGLLGRFAFIPFARLDDLMISYAAPGGGVGPHFDSYDVFLLQGPGRRRWQISEQDDLRLQPGLPLRVLSHFKPSASWDLDPGDMLYLPPSIAHDGVALTECMTYSIGFRAAGAQELAERFVQQLPELVPLGDERYADPDLKATRTPARIEPAMQRRLRAMIDGIRWDGVVVERFIGRMLSEPNASVVFEGPAKPMSFALFGKRIDAGAALRVDRRARLLYDASRVYLNGEEIEAPGAHPALMSLADNRELRGSAAIDRATLHILYAAYLEGVLHFGR